MCVRVCCQICGDYLLSKMDAQSAISYRHFASGMNDGRLLGKIDGFIQEHLLEVSEQDDFLKLPRLKVKSPDYSLALKDRSIHLYFPAHFNVCRTPTEFSVCYFRLGCPSE